MPVNIAANISDKLWNRNVHVEMWLRMVRVANSKHTKSDVIQQYFCQDFCIIVQNIGLAPTTFPIKTIAIYMAVTLETS